MLAVEVLGAAPGLDAELTAQLRELCARTAASRGVRAGHVAIEFVDGERIAALNAAHRGKAEPTDVLSFPIDGPELAAAPATARVSGEHAEVELGDIVISPAHTADLREAVVHGMLHLLGMDHERDDGEMLALQARLLGAAAR